MSVPCPQLTWSITACKGRLTECAPTQQDAFVLKLCKPVVSACTNDNPENRVEDLPGVFVPGDFARLWNIDPNYRATAILTLNPNKYHPCPCKVRRSLCLTITGAIAECGKPCATLTLVGFFASNPNPCYPPTPRKLSFADATLAICGPTPDGPVTASCDCILDGSREPTPCGPCGAAHVDDWASDSDDEEK